MRLVQLRTRAELVERNEPVEQFGAQRLRLSARLGVRAEDVAEQRVQLVLGTHLQLQCIHERDKVLRRLSDDLRAHRWRLRLAMLDRRRDAQHETMHGCRLIHVEVAHKVMHITEHVRRRLRRIRDELDHRLVLPQQPRALCGVGVVLHGSSHVRALQVIETRYEAIQRRHRLVSLALLACVVQLLFLPSARSHLPRTHSSPPTRHRPFHVEAETTEFSASTMAEEAARPLVLDARNASFTSVVHIHADTSLRVSDLKLSISEHVRTTQCSREGWPRASGMRCIYRGGILGNDVSLATLFSEEQPVVVHVVVQPEAWVPFVSTDTPAASAPPPAPPAHADSAASPLATLQSLPRRELAPMLSALYMTLSSYYAYYEELCESFARPCVLARPVPMHDVERVDDPAVRAAAIHMIESHIMHWTPLRAESEKACTEEPRYEHVTLCHLPFLLRTMSPRAPTHLLPLLETRIVTLLMLYAHFHAHDTERRDAPRMHRRSWTMSRDDWVALIGFLFRMVGRTLMFAVLLLPNYLEAHLWRVLAALLVFNVAAAMWFVHRRRPQAPAPASSDAPSPPVRAAPSAPLSSTELTLEIPRLPHRVPTVPPTTCEYWMQRMAWFGLEEEEVAMGFEHVPPTEPRRIMWEARAWPAQQRRPMPPRPPTSAVVQYVLKPLVVFLMTLEPEMDKLRSDALLMRKDAICALARRWKELQEQHENEAALSGSTPSILLHPYARRVLLEEERHSAQMT